jgi:hypothetical protein
VGNTEGMPEGFRVTGFFDGLIEGLEVGESVGFLEGDTVGTGLRVGAYDDERVPTTKYEYPAAKYRLPLEAMTGDCGYFEVTEIHFKEPADDKAYR